MTRRKIGEDNIRKITKVGGSSYAVTVPLEIIKEFGWKEKQKVVVQKRGNEIVIKDWVDPAKSLSKKGTAKRSR